jgi:metal-responsive CopG/Arc/MetJ family transcriptional regulator
MHTVSTHPQKAKITVTLSHDLVEQLDAFLDSPRAPSRSRLVEDALRRWLHDQAQMELERQTEEYYLSLSEAEHEEDRQWAKTSVRSAKRLWEK